MANENVSPKILKIFEHRLIAHATRDDPNSTGHSYALGYILSMIQNGNINDDSMLTHITSLLEGSK